MNYSLLLRIRALYNIELDKICLKHVAFFDFEMLLSYRLVGPTHTFAFVDTLAPINKLLHRDCGDIEFLYFWEALRKLSCDKDLQYYLLNRYMAS